MTDKKLKRVVIHHTAGTYVPNDLDMHCYHLLVDNVGKVIKGVYTPEDNINCVDGKYASHILLGNTGSIGVACCGNLNYSYTNQNNTNYPLTKEQIEAMCSLIAKLCVLYEIYPTYETVFTHFEYCERMKKLGKDYGNKIDITYLPYLPNLGPYKVAMYLRQKVLVYYNRYIKLKKGVKL